MQKAGEAARASIKRQQWEKSRVGGYNDMSDSQRIIHAQILPLSSLMARIFETACLAGWLHVHVPSFPTFQDFTSGLYKLQLCAGTFASNGEDSGGFNKHTVLSTFLLHLFKDAGVEGDVFFLVVDMLPPMATYIPCLHDEDEHKELFHIDSIQFFKHLAPSLQEVLRRNLHELVILLTIARENVMTSTD